MNTFTTQTGTFTYRLGQAGVVLNDVISISGSPISSGDYDEVCLVVKNLETGTSVTLEADFSESVSGGVSYTWEPNDLPTIGTYAYQWELIKRTEGGGIESHCTAPTDSTVYIDVIAATADFEDPNPPQTP